VILCDACGARLSPDNPVCYPCTIKAVEMEATAAMAQADRMQTCAQELQSRLAECRKVLNDATAYIQAYHREYGGLLDKAGDGLVLISRMKNAGHDPL
jgi:hypothetical protein